MDTQVMRYAIVARSLLHQKLLYHIPFISKYNASIFNEIIVNISHDWINMIHNFEYYIVIVTSMKRSTVRIVKSTLSWIGIVTKMGDTRATYKLLVRKPFGKRMMEDQDGDRRSPLR
jgi:hypothetical protein